MWFFFVFNMPIWLYWKQKSVDFYPKYHDSLFMIKKFGLGVFWFWVSGLYSGVKLSYLFLVLLSGRRSSVWQNMVSTPTNISLQMISFLTRLVWISLTEQNCGKSESSSPARVNQASMGLVALSNQHILSRIRPFWWGRHCFPGWGGGYKDLLKLHLNILGSVIFFHPNFCENMSIKDNWKYYHVKIYFQSFEKQSEQVINTPSESPRKVLWL